MLCDMVVSDKYFVAVLGTLTLIAAAFGDTAAILKIATSSAPTMPCSGWLDGSAEHESRMLELAMGSVRHSTQLTTIACGSCHRTVSILQYWCKHRAEGTDCSGETPWNNNFKFKRWMRYYECPNGKATCCEVWETAGCCNNSSSAPPCLDPSWGNTECSESECP